MRRSLSTIWAGRVARATDRIVPVLASLWLSDFGVISGVNLSRLGMTDNDRQRRDHKPSFIGNPERTKPECLTHKAICESLALPI